VIATKYFQKVPRAAIPIEGPTLTARRFANGAAKESIFSCAFQYLGHTESFNHLGPPPVLVWWRGHEVL
jgi:hypothetical protein